MQLLTRSATGLATDPSFGEAGWFSLREALERLRHEEERLFFQEHLTPLFE